MDNGENNKGKGETSVSRRHYREKMERAAKDSGFIQDNKEAMDDFAVIDEEMLEMSSGYLPSDTDKPVYRRDESGIFRLYPGGRKKYAREKRLQIPNRQPLNPPLKAIQTAIRKAITKIHAAGMATVHCDKRGRAYLRHPDGRKEFCKPVISSPEADSDD